MYHVSRIETYQIATYNIRKLLKMDSWSPKHVELLNVMNKINHQILCILLGYTYIAKLYTVHTVSKRLCEVKVTPWYDGEEVEVQLPPIPYLNTRKRVGGQHYTPTALAAGKTVNYCSRSWVGLGTGLERHEKSRHPPGLDPRTAQPVASRYKHSDVPAANSKCAT